MKSSTTNFKDFKELTSLHKKAEKPQRLSDAIHPQAFNLDDEDPELDLNTWTTVGTNAMNRGTRYQRLLPNEMSIRFQVSSAHRKKLRLAPDAITEACEMYIRFGSKIIKSLKWHAGEELAVFQHPQDKSVYGLMPKKAGRKLRLESPDAQTYCMHFSFPNETKRLTAHSKIVEYTVHENGYLLFRLPPPDKD